jgi:hypothetical protein
MSRRLTPNERARVQARSGLATDTIRAIELGQSVREASLLRFRRAVSEEGITVLLSDSEPPPPSARVA